MNFLSASYEVPMEIGGKWVANQWRIMGKQANTALQSLFFLLSKTCEILRFIIQITL